MKQRFFWKWMVFPFLAPVMYAQSGAVSPYSYFGIGSIESFNSSRYYSLGQTGIALRSDLSINSRNPASLTGIPSQSFLYDLGLQSSVNTSTSNSDKQTRFDGGLSNLGIGFRLNDHFAMAMGMEPVSQSKYKISSDSPFEGTAQNYSINLEGEGGISRVYSSLGFQLNDNFSLGGTINYFFGSVDQSETLHVNSETITDFVVSKDHQYFGIGFGLGMQYHHRFSDNLNFTVGGILNFKSKIGQTTETNVSTILDDSSYDETLGEEKTNVYLPLESGVGIAFDVGRNWKITTDYTNKRWDKLKYTNTQEVYTNENIFGLGAEFNPRVLPNQPYYKKISYRMGLNYSTGNFKINENQVDKISAGFGLGLPIAKSGMNLNFAYNFAKRGWISDAYVKDNYHLFSINFSGFENWFLKKYIP